MSRAQVTMALGYPPPRLNPVVSAPVWKYWTAVGDLIIDLNFDADNNLTKISGDTVAVRLVEIQP